MEREYIVTLKRFEDLEDFYNDMETPGGNLYIPDRNVSCHLRRNISRNTHYLLTDEEADQVRNDPRVLGVDLTPSERGLTVTKLWTQTGDFKKDNYTNFSSTDKSWGLLRCILGEDVAGWGEGGTSTSINTTIKTSSSGKNIDVVICDEHIEGNHPEFAVNPDGTGGSRFQAIDWIQDYSSYLGISTTNNYSYYFEGSHGTHVAGTTAGNTQGWARDANIYNISPFYTPSPSATNWVLLVIDYIRAFHLNKPINPETGRRNPTITNHSWGFTYVTNFLLSNITSVNYRGSVTAVNGFTNALKKTTLEQNGVPCPNGISLINLPARDTGVDADIQDAINDGVIFIASAGNSYWELSTDSNHADWNNYVVYSGSTIYHARGQSPGSADGVICVGAIDSQDLDYKAEYSNWGPRVDIWAPGTNIISSLYNASDTVGGIAVNDPRDSNYKLSAASGTSMASPQVCGIVACLAEQEPDMNQSDVRAYLLQHEGSFTDQIHLQEPSSEWVADGSKKASQTPYRQLSQDDNNNYVTYWPKRKYDGYLTPLTNHKRRPQSGQLFPRTRGRR